MTRLDATVGQKLAVGFGIVIALVAVLGGVAIVASGRVQTLQARQATVMAPREDAAAALEVAVLNAAVAARNYILTRAPAERTMLDRAVAALARRHEVLVGLPGEADDRGLAEQIAPLLADYQARLDTFVRVTGSAA
ncbi:MAG TPA: hypothetical protein VLK35_06145, partial [Methylomirabilota bacterium]|nr:hypothetical protein [Methylomirabilota bacterium]